MAKVVLLNNFFAPGGVRFRKDPNGGPVSIPDEIVHNGWLPTTARVISMDDGSTPPPYRPRPQEGVRSPFPIQPGAPLPGQVRPPATGLNLRDFDEVRVSQEAVDARIVAQTAADKKRANLAKARAAKKAKKETVE
jgi:hypothetical protein